MENKNGTYNGNDEKKRKKMKNETLEMGVQRKGETMSNGRKVGWRNMEKEKQNCNAHLYAR